MAYEGIYEAYTDLMDLITPQAQKLVPFLGGRPVFDFSRAYRLMEGAIDTHIHPGPDTFNARPYDDFDIAVAACEMGMGAVVLKCLSGSTARSTRLVQRMVDQWAKEHSRKSIKVIGGLVLGHYCGGLNPEAVRVTAKFGGKFIWTPIIDSIHHQRTHGIPGGIEVIGDDGKVLPKLAEILEIIAENDLVLSIGHHSTRERFIILDAAIEAGVKRIEIVHPFQPYVKMTIDQAKMAADKGAYIGHYCCGFDPLIWSLEETIQAIKTIGADHIVLGTDCGNWKLPPPAENYRRYLGVLLEAGIPEADVEKMAKLNAQKLIF